MTYERSISWGSPNFVATPDKTWHCRRNIQQPTHFSNWGAESRGTVICRSKLARAFADGFAFELVEDAGSDINQILIHGLGAINGVRKRNGDDLVAAQGGHLAELAAMSHVNRPDAIPGGEHTIEGTGRAAALDVSQHHRAGFESGAVLDFASENVADTAQAHVAELILAQFANDGRAVLWIHIAGELGTFGNHDDAEVTAARVPEAD